MVETTRVCWSCSSRANKSTTVGPGEEENPREKSPGRRRRVPNPSWTAQGLPRQRRRGGRQAAKERQRGSPHPGRGPKRTTGGHKRAGRQRPLTRRQCPPHPRRLAATRVHPWAGRPGSHETPAGRGWHKGAGSGRCTPSVRRGVAIPADRAPGYRERLSQPPPRKRGTPRVSLVGTRTAQSSASNTKGSKTDSAPPDTDYCTRMQPPAYLQAQTGQPFSSPSLLSSTSPPRPGTAQRTLASASFLLLGLAGRPIPWWSSPGGGWGLA